MGIFILGLVLITDRTVAAEHITQPVKIDGYLEEIWFTADSAYDFVQYQPNEGALSTEPTVVYILTDKENIYVAFRCYTPGRKPFASFKGLEDHVYLFIDTFNNRTTAYYFAVCASGYHEDGLILEDGKIWDGSWDGVWYYGTHCYDDRLEIEFKIPFKSIRYKKDVSCWGINFQRQSIKDLENTYWAPVTRKDKFQVSTFGTLTNIEPQSGGYYIELYPEVYLRYDKITDSKNLEPNASFNVKWDLTPQATLNTTFYPDFAHIESDPYTLNLSQYPVRLEEHRPFFVEGSDIFHMANIGASFFTPLRIFYTRRIGKPLANSGSVPILTGVKFINKEHDWNLGLLGSVADEITDEARRFFGVVRIKRSVLDNSDIGLMLSSTATAKDDYNLAFGLDLAYRSGPSQIVMQSAISDYNEKLDWAFSGGGLYRAPNYNIMTNLLYVADSFDVSDIGYVPWAGRTKIYLKTGPCGYPKKGPVLSYFIGPGLYIVREPGSQEWSRNLLLALEPRFRNNWGMTMQIMTGYQYEADTSYFYKDLYVSIWSGYHVKYRSSFGFELSHCYNYNQSWLANQLTGWFWGAFFPISPLSLSLSLDNVVEWDPQGQVVAITPYATPRIEYCFAENIEASIYSQIVFQTESGDIETAKVSSNRLGFLFSWNFLPKSWFYIAFNDLRVDNGTGLEPFERIGAIKAKYLFYF